MKTYRLKDNGADIRFAAGIIKSGGLVAFPTETVYGLGGNAEDADSAKKIYAAKGRPSDNPLIIHLPEAEEAEKYAYTNELYYKLAAAFCPGPLTMILKKKDTVPYEVTGGLDTVALRIPSHPVAREFIKACGAAVAAPSANISGSPSPTSAAHVLRDLDGRIDAVIDGGECEIGLESTIIKLCDDRVVMLRPGAVTEEMISKIVRVGRDKTLLSKPEDDFRPEAPGMKYRHYAPSAPVTLLRGAPSDVAGFMSDAAKEDKTGVICYKSYEKYVSGQNVKYIPDDPEGQANTLFSVLRDFDGTGVLRIYSVIPSRVGVGFAVYNRLIKAAGFNVKQVGVTIPVIGLTGQSGSGKSTVASIFKSKGAYVADCDEIYHEMLYDGSPLVKKLEERFPQAVNNGHLDRKTLSGIVFSDKEKLRELNRITHGVILDEVRAGLKAAQADGYGFATVDASQLFESGFDTECTAVIGVVANEEDRIKRLMTRDGLDVESITARLKNQHNEDFFRVYCNDVLENDGDYSALEEKVDDIIKKYVKGK